MIRSGALTQSLINLMRDQMPDYDIIQMDETPVQILKELDKRAIIVDEIEALVSRKINKDQIGAG